MSLFNDDIPTAVEQKRKGPVITKPAPSKKVVVVSSSQAPSSGKRKGKEVAGSQTLTATKNISDKPKKSLAELVLDRIEESWEEVENGKLVPLARYATERASKLVGIFLEVSSKVDQQANELREAKVLAERAEKEKEELTSQVGELKAQLQAANRLEKERDVAKAEAEEFRRQLNDLSAVQGEFVQEAVRKVVQTKGFVSLIQTACQGFQEVGRHEGLFAAKALHPEVVPSNAPWYFSACMSRANNVFSMTLLEFTDSLPLTEYIKNRSGMMSVEDFRECPEDCNDQLVVGEEVDRDDEFFEALVAKELDYDLASPVQEEPSQAEAEVEVEDGTEVGAEAATNEAEPANNEASA